MADHKLIVGWVALVALVPLGCQSAPRYAMPRGGGSDRTVEFVAVPPPPGLSSKQIAPRGGDDLVKANLSLQKILESLPKPQYLPPDDQGQVPESAPVDDPPLAAQRFYFEGRQAWLERRNFEAIDKLQSAFNLAPDSAAIARLLGKIQAQTNRVQAEHLLQKAVQLDPDDPESLFLLAGLVRRQNRFDEAIVLLARALRYKGQVRDVDPAIWTLAHYDLGVALVSAEYDQAAIVQFINHIETPRYIMHMSGAHRRLYRLQRSRSLTWLMIGDAHHRIDQPGAAIQAYEKVWKIPPKNRDPLLSRMVFSYLRLGRVDQASKLAVASIGLITPEKELTALLRYLVEQGAARDDLALALRRAYEQAGRSSSLAISIAALLTDDDATRFLGEHLAHEPVDVVAFEELIGRLLCREAAPTDEQRLAEAVRITAATISAVPGAGQWYAEFLIERVESPVVLLDALARVKPAETSRTGRGFLRAFALERLGRKKDAVVQFELVLDDNADFEVARIYLARLLIEQQQYTRAGRILDPLIDKPDPSIVSLRVAVLANTGRTEQAMKLLDDLITRYPDNLEIVLQKTRLQMDHAQYIAAEYLLSDKLNAHPGAEALYEALFALYEHRRVPDAERRFSRLLDRARQHVPQSWIFRLKMAEVLMLSGNAEHVGRAEKQFKDLMVQRPHDYRPLNGLLDLLWRTKRRHDANTLIDQRIEAEPDNSSLLQVALIHYEDRAKNRRRLHEVSVLYLLTQPPDEQRDTQLGYQYLLLDQAGKTIEYVGPYLHKQPKDPDAVVSLLRRACVDLGQIAEAENLIRLAIDRFAEHRSDLTLQLAILYDQTDRFDKAVQMMLRILIDDPDHAPTNNMLGYNWAVRGENLARAKSLVERALELDQNSVAYRDSLGWIYYKMGRFNDALRELNRAIAEEGGDNSVILDHLGDALYRAGRRKDAVVKWQLAVKRYDSEMARIDPEMVGLENRTSQKVQAVRARKQPELAAVAATPPASPATRTYTVLPDESLGSIAEKLFGSSKHWVEIALVNPGIKLGQLEAGQVIRVPESVPPGGSYRSPVNGS